MKYLHQKLTQKYPKYHHWHQTKHYNKAHWGVFIVFILVLFSFIIFPVQINLRRGSSIIAPTIQTQKTTAAGTWQQTLEQNFDIADTFDFYRDWSGETTTPSAEGRSNPTNFWYYPSDGIPDEQGWWITNHGSNKQVGSKSIKLSTHGYGAKEIKMYIGDGRPNSGYSDSYVFFRLYLPRNTWPTYVVREGNHGLMGYREGDPYIFLTGWKFFNIGTGFCDVLKWEDPGDDDNVCGSGYYGDSDSIYGSTEAWYNLLYNDPNPYTISSQLQLFFSQYNYPAKPNFVSTDELVGIELHYKLESNSSCTINSDCDGVFESWVYSSSNPNGLKLQDTQKIKFRPAGHETAKINRLWINGNKHRYEAPSTGEYYCADGMDCVMYVDDFIVDDQRIGPTYFSLLNNLPPPSDTTPPTTPTNSTTTAISSSQINLSWTASTDAESGIASYKIYRNGAIAGQSTATSFSDTGLTESTTYTYEISAVNGSGLESDKTTPVLATTLADTTLPTITSVSAAGDATQVTILFSEPVDQTSAATTSNYAIDNGITISSASLGTDQKTVTLTTSAHQENITYTLTVNNIKDKAKTQNTILPNTQKTYTFAAKLTITNLSVSSGKIYEIVEDGLNNGALAYIDRTFTYSSIPQGLQNSTYIKTANSDKLSQGDNFLTFQTNQDITIYRHHIKNPH